MKPTKEIVRSLTKARDLLQTHELAKGAFARNAAGKTTDVLSEDATKFCFVGALARVEGTSVNKGDHADDVCRRVKSFAYVHGLLEEYREIPIFNDRKSTTKEDVVTLFDIVIADAKARLKA